MNTIVENGWHVSYLIGHSAFEELSKAEKIAKIGKIIAEDIDPLDCFEIGERVLIKQTEIRKPLIKAIVLFQASMEATIKYIASYDPDIEANGGFIQKWQNAFRAKGEDYDFSGYTTFYRQLRNAIIHPDTEERIEIINRLEFLQVYRGIQAGWNAFCELSRLTARPHDEKSWEIMCNLHQLPSSCDAYNYPNLFDLHDLLLTKYLSYLNDR